MRKALLIPLALFLSGCSPRAAMETVRQRDTLWVSRRTVDTLVVTEPDTASLRLLVECDERNGALVAMLESASGERLSLKPSVKYVYVKDTAGNVSRKAYISLSAVAAAQRLRIAALEEEVRGGSSAASAKEEKKGGGFPAWWLAAAFAAGGLAMCLVTGRLRNMI